MSNFSKMKYFLTISLLGLLQLTAIGQLPVSTSPLSERLTRALDRSQTESNRSDSARRTVAVSGLLKAQRQIWSAARQSTFVENVELRNAAKTTLISALESDPTLAEAYTMLAELELTSQSQNVPEALAFTGLAIRSNPENYGGHRLQARILTRTSSFNRPTFDRNIGLRAIAAWKQVVRLDPLNAEAWAFLSKLYEATNEPDQQLAALRKWTGSPAPLDSGFYRAVIGREAELTPEAASIDLATALIKRSLAEEAVDILTLIIIDNPDNRKALDLVSKAVDSEPKPSRDKIGEKLRSALSSNPGNAALILLVEKIKLSQM